VLGQTGGLAGAHHQLAKRGLVGGMDGFAPPDRRSIKAEWCRGSGDR
jgi:hypothetical protein